MRKVENISPNNSRCLCSAYEIILSFAVKLRLSAFISYSSYYTRLKTLRTCKECIELLRARDENLCIVLIAAASSFIHVNDQLKTATHFLRRDIEGDYSKVDLAIRIDTGNNEENA